MEQHISLSINLLLLLTLPRTTLCSYRECKTSELVYRAISPNNLLTLNIWFSGNCCLVQKHQKIDQLLYNAISRYPDLGSPFRAARKLNHTVQHHMFLDVNTGDILPTYLELIDQPDNKYLVCIKTHPEPAGYSLSNSETVLACGTNLSVTRNAVQLATSVKRLGVCYPNEMSPGIDIHNTELEELIVNGIQIEGFTVHAPSLKKLFLYLANIQVIRFSEATRRSVTHVDIHGSALYNIGHIIEKVSIFSSLVSLNTSHSRYLLHNMHFNIVKIPSLEIIDVSHTFIDISGFFNVLLRLPHLKSISLSGNDILVFKPTTFSHLQNLREIRLKGCLKSASKRNFELQLNSSESIDFIDVSSNNLNKVRIESSRRIDTLDLSMNSLTIDDFVVECESSPCVKKLNISHNNIVVKTKALKKLEDIDVVDIGNNIISCSDCEFLRDDAFHKVLKNQTGIKYFDLSSEVLKCTTPDEMKGRPLYSVDVDALCPLDYTLIAIFITMGVILIISLALASVGYKYRRTIRYMIAYTKLVIENNRIQETDTEGYKYDAFVSYSCKSRNWVFDKLRPALEIEEPEKYKLCLKDEHLQLGTDKLQKLDECVQCSRYYIMVLTKEFWEDQICLWEERMIKNKVMSCSEGSVIIIALEGLNYTEIPQELRVHNFARAYIKWNTEKLIRNSSLVKRLKQSLGKSIYRKNLERQVEGFVEEAEDEL